MLARYHSSQQARFLSVDPIRNDESRLEEPQKLNLYAYVANNPLKYIDPNGQDSFLVSRPLGNDPNSKYAHLFVVSHAKFVGDSNGRVHSFGQKDNGNMGRVDSNTTNKASATTHASDNQAWKSAGSDANVAVEPIPAADDVVSDNANAVMENQDYAALGGIWGVNSNSASVAVAEESAGQDVPVPGTRNARGEGNADKVQFDKNKDGKPDPRVYKNKP